LRILHLLLYKTPGQSQAIAALGPRSIGERGLRLAEEHRRRRRNHPLRWTPQDAVRFLQVEAMERACLVIRMPANWRMNRPSRPSVEATVGSASPSVLGTDALLDFRVQVSLDGEILTIEEIKELLGSTHGLALLRGKWVEVDPKRLRWNPTKLDQASQGPAWTCAHCAVGAVSWRRNCYRGSV
jgi:SNF2 Helicase protein